MTQIGGREKEPGYIALSSGHAGSSTAPAVSGTNAASRPSKGARIRAAAPMQAPAVANHVACLCARPPHDSLARAPRNPINTATGSCIRKNEAADNAKQIAVRSSFPSSYL
jgi:hypothetical protein